MTIGIDLRTFLDQPLTGVGIYLQGVLDELFKIDLKNHYKLYINNFGNLPELVEKYRCHQQVKIYAYRCPNKLLNASLFFLKRPLLDKLIAGCDIFWFPNLNFWQTSKNCPYLVTVHDLSFERIPWSYSLKTRYWHKLINPQKRLKQAKKIFAVSESTKSDLQKVYQLPKEKIKVIYPGPGLFNDQPINSSAGQPLTLPDNYLLFLGTLEPRKNVATIIRAFELLALPNYFLVIAGKAGWRSREVYRLKNNSSAKEKIIFLNYVDDRQKRQLYRQAKVFIWPSFYEGFGFPILEAHQQGCPVITSANSSLPEVAGEAAIYVDPYNIQEIASAIKLLINDSIFRQDLVNKGKDNLLRFSWSKAAAEILEIFKESNQ